MNAPSFVKSHVHAQPMEMTISNASWLVPFLLSAHWAPKNNKFPSALSLCSGKVLTPNSLPPRSRSLRWALPSLRGVIEPILTSLLPFHALAKLQRDTILHMMIHSVKLLWDEMSHKMLRPRGKGRKIHPQIFCHTRAKIHLSSYSRAYKASLTFQHQRITELQYLINLHFFLWLTWTLAVSKQYKHSQRGNKI